MGALGVSSGLSVGAASTIIDVPIGAAMAGYAARRGAADAVLDNLAVRAAVFSQDGTVVVLAVCDLLYIPEVLTARIRVEIARSPQLARAAVMVSATHTHCGPALSDPFHAEQLLGAVTRAAVTSVQTAAGQLQEVTLLTTESRLTGLACNRRDPHAVVDTRVGILVAVALAGDPVLTLVSAACHPTILEHDTTAYARDFPGALCDAVQGGCGGTAIYVQGAAGDVNPIFTGHTPADVRRHGSILGARVVDAVLSTLSAHADPRTINLSRGEVLAVPVQDVGRAVVTDGLASGQRDVTVRVDPLPLPSVIEHHLASARDAVGAARDRAERWRARAEEARWWAREILVSDPIYLDLDPVPASDATIGVQVLTLGAGLHVVAFPGELFAASARQLRSRCADEVILVGYANQSVGYLPPREEYDDAGYEIGSARYAAGTAEQLVDAAAEMVAGSSGNG